MNFRLRKSLGAVGRKDTTAAGLEGLSLNDNTNAGKHPARAKKNRNTNIGGKGGEVAGFGRITQKKGNANNGKDYNSQGRF